MKRSILKTALAGCVVAGALICLVSATAQAAPPPTSPQIVQVQPAQPVPPPEQPVAQPAQTVAPTPVTVARPKVPGTEEIRVNTLSATTFVVVKDFGDHQLVIVYQVDDKGKVSQTDKKKFFY